MSLWGRPWSVDHESKRYCPDASVVVMPTATKHQRASIPTWPVARPVSVRKLILVNDIRNSDDEIITC